MFLDGVIRQLDVFAIIAGVPSEEVVVRLTFVDGDSVTIRGIEVAGPFGTNDWGMIRGVGATSTGAIVIREEDVRKVEFQVAPSVSPGMGFRAEAR